MSYVKSSQTGQPANEWWRHLKGRPFYWAVDGTHPGADLFVLRHVMGRPKRSRGLRAAQLALQVSPQVETLITRLEDKTASLWHRYDGMIWILNVLAEVGISGYDERIAEALDWLLEQSLEQTDAPIHAKAILLYIALAFGFADDERVQACLHQVEHQVKGYTPPFTRAEVDGLILAAMALAEQPMQERNTETVARLKKHFMTLEPQKWLDYQKYGFPTFDQPDDLLLAQAALCLEIAGEWLQPWITRIEQAQDERGLWHLNRALPVAGEGMWENQSQPSRWISAKAMYVLRAFYGE